MARFFPLVFGALVCLAIRSCQADGRVFVLEMQNVSKSGYEWARQACVAHSARLASTADLWHAILECFFSVCTRGWMDGAAVGTTICKGEGGSGLRTVDVKMEENVAEEDGIRLDAFCVKDKGSPCGAPPTFPHTHMQSQTGLELGDELVFVCESGYSLASGDTAFSLLCDSCGEWYGLVQLCVKDDAEAHQDYEDKFPNEDNIYTGSEAEGSPAAEGEHEEEEEAEEVEEEVEEEQENEDTHSEANTEGGTHGEAGERGEHGGEVEETGVEQAGEVDEKEEKENEDVHAGSVTDPPVSLLSQKHLFWFPSEAFHDDDDDDHHDDHHDDTHASDHKHSGAKEADSVAGAGTEHEEHHHGDEHDAEEEMPTDEVLQHTDKSWLDGYPVDEEFTKSTEIGSEEKESKEAKDVSKEHKPPKSEEEKEVQDVSKEHDPVKSKEEAEEEGEEREEEEENERATDSSEEMFKEVIERPDTAAEVHPTFFINVSDVTTESPFQHSTTESMNGDGSDAITPSGVGPYDMTVDTTATTVVYPSSTSTTPGFFHHHLTLPTESNEVTAVPEDVTSVPYHVTLSPDDVITAGDDLGTPLIFATVLPDDDDITTLSTDVPVLIHDFSGLDSDRHNLTKQSMPTEDPCDVDTCPSSRSTSLVAIVTVVTIVAVAGLILGAWLFRRRQLKSSHYQFNGTNSHTQNFEMQQTV